MHNLVVQLWGIGNLVQTEPLLRALGKGDILVDRARSTQELSPFFPKWNFLARSESEAVQGYWEDVYLCWPVDPRPYKAIANRVHVPVWSWRVWEDSEATVLRAMLGPGYPQRHEDFVPRLQMPHQVTQRAGSIAMSIGYLKAEGWSQKHWGSLKFQEAVRAAWQAGYTSHLFGSQEDYEIDGKEILQGLDLPSSAWKSYFHCPLWEQIEVLAGCRGYVGNDTGLAHVAGALGLPTAVYTVTDRVKNRPAGECFQFGAETHPREAVAKLVEVFRAQERA